MVVWEVHLMGKLYTIVVLSLSYNWILILRGLAGVGIGGTPHG